MNDLVINHDDNNFSQKLKQTFQKLIDNIFNLKNALRILELLLLIILNAFYGKKPFVNWSGLKVD